MTGTEFPIDVDLIARVEVIRGRNSSLYVASAFLGVINIITKRGQQLPGMTVAGEVAGYGTYQGRVRYGQKFDNGWEVLLSSSFYNPHGHDHLFFKEFDSPVNNNGVAVDADVDEFHQFFADVSWDPCWRGMPGRLTYQELAITEARLIRRVSRWVTHRNTPGLLRRFLRAEYQNCYSTQHRPILCAFLHSL
jgi:outer membrane cobalamin receptor